MKDWEKAIVSIRPSEWIAGKFPGVDWDAGRFLKDPGNKRPGHPIYAIAHFPKADGSTVSCGDRLEHMTITYPTEKKEMTNTYDDVNYSSVILLIGEEIAEAVRVEYEPGQKPKNGGDGYLFKALRDQNLQKGDFVAVQTDTRWGLTVCKVVETGCEVDFDSNLQLKWIVSKVDTDRFDEIKVMEEDAIRALKQDAAAEKKRKMQERMTSIIGNRVKSLPIYTLKGEDTAPAPDHTELNDLDPDDKIQF